MDTKTPKIMSIKEYLSRCQEFERGNFPDGYFTYTHTDSDAKISFIPENRFWAQIRYVILYPNNATENGIYLGNDDLFFKNYLKTIIFNHKHETI